MWLEILTDWTEGAREFIYLIQSSIYLFIMKQLKQPFRDNAVKLCIRIEAWQLRWCIRFWCILFYRRYFANFIFSPHEQEVAAGWEDQGLVEGTIQWVSWEF